VFPDTIQVALQAATQRLSGISETASLDAQVLLAHILNRPRSWLLAHPETRLSEEQQSNLVDGIAQLVEGKPLPYLLGSWEFYGLSFFVTPDVLIPRPETELLVETAINWLNSRRSKNPSSIPVLRVLDAGSGSGCIAIALAKHIPELVVLGSDISIPALRIAQKNASLHEVDERILLVCADLLPPVQVHFDLICANLPYIPRENLPNLSVHRYEPGQALDGGQGGLQVSQRFLDACQNRLNPGGMLLVEIEASQGNQAVQLAQRVFPTASVSVQRDLSANDRLVVIRTS